jgi:hypothetical protein
MTEETGLHKNPAEVLRLPHLPPPQPKVEIDRAKLAFQVAIIHKMSIDDISERNDAKYLRDQKSINLGDEKSETRKQMQMIAINKIGYWESALAAAKIAAREACEKDLGNLKYLKFLAELEEIII